MGKWGWSFYPPVRDENGDYVDLKAPDQVGPDDGMKGVIRDPLYDTKFIRELYFRVEEGYTGRFTVPVLWDKKAEKIVNNESSEIIRMFNSEVGVFAPLLIREFTLCSLSYFSVQLAAPQGDCRDRPVS